MPKFKQIISPKAPLFQTKNIEDLVETECLFGEKFIVKRELKEWAFGTLYTDNYEGWLETKHLGNFSINNYVVINRSSNIYMKPNDRSIILQKLSLGSQLNVVEIKNKWAKIYFNNSNYQNKGFVPTNHISKDTKKSKDWINYCHKMIGTPYVWGGRSSDGIDCSALLQLSFQAIGIMLPRNTTQQQNYMKLSKNFKQLKVNFFKRKIYQKGMIIFWPGHVGIISRKNTLLHSNAKLMIVCEENIHEALYRLKSKNILPFSAFKLDIF